jgi:hypothetical protein
MKYIKVNKLVWDSVSEADKQNITEHLREYGVLKPDQEIVADAHTPLPAITPHIHDTRTKTDENFNALGVDWICRAICDSTHSESDCSVYGQSLPACLATIAASREARNSG